MAFFFFFFFLGEGGGTPAITLLFHKLVAALCALFPNALRFDVTKVFFRGVTDRTPAGRDGRNACGFKSFFYFNFIFVTDCFDLCRVTFL